jgi:hypothetical protein
VYVLLTIHLRSWYHQPAKKASHGLAVCSSYKEKHISANDFRVNEGIRVAEVRLIGSDGNNVGVVPIKKALEMARDAELDLRSRPMPTHPSAV